MTRIFKAAPIRYQSNLAQFHLQIARDLKAISFRRFWKIKFRKLKLSGRIVPDPPTSGCRAPLRASVMEDRPPWSDLSVDPIAMPGMISEEEARYYEYIGQSYEGRGEVIELGPWLGKSTRHIIRGLERNPNLLTRRSMSSMILYGGRVGWTGMCRSATSFRTTPIFARSLKDTFKGCGRNSTLPGQKSPTMTATRSLTRVHWDRAPIEIMYIDCGRTLQANEGWFEVFSSSFIPDVSLLILQDWRTHRERPRLCLTTKCFGLRRRIRNLSWFTK